MLLSFRLYTLILSICRNWQDVGREAVGLEFPTSSQLRQIDKINVYKQNDNNLYVAKNK